nr:reverse transcriptase domain-containing protein [Tanacetum cinerariifolium]
LKSRYVVTTEEHSDGFSRFRKRSSNAIGEDRIRSGLRQRWFVQDEARKEINGRKRSQPEHPSKGRRSEESGFDGTNVVQSGISGPASYDRSKSVGRVTLSQCQPFNETRCVKKESYGIRQKPCGNQRSRRMDERMNSAPDYYPLSDIDGKIESVVGFRYKCFIDTYKGYHQVQMALDDEENMAFYTDHGTYCYMKMSFGLKNAGATYQRLVDTTFQSHIGRNLEAYVDDMVIKSNDEKVLIADIVETFKNLRRINMKLISKKCSFEDITKENKDEYRWTESTEKAFKEMKKFIVELPLLTTPVMEETTVRVPGSGNGGREYGVADRKKREALSDILWLRMARKIKVKDINVKVDSKLVVSQINGNYVASSTGMLKYMATTKECIDGFKIFAIKNIPRNLKQKADILSKLATHAFDHLMKKVLVEVLAERLIDRKEVSTIVEEEEDKWMTPIIRCLAEGGNSHRILRDAHRGEVRGRESYKAKGTDILASGKLKVVIVAIDYFTKWIEAKSLAIITGRDVKKFVWDNIVCRFRLPRVIVIENGTQFVNDPFKGWREVAAIREAKYKTKMEQYYNQKASLTSFKPDEYLYQRNEGRRVEDQGKLGPKWEGPYRLMKAYQNGSYNVANNGRKQSAPDLAPHQP